jgi:hypothetical protein
MGISAIGSSLTQSVPLQAVHSQAVQNRPARHHGNDHVAIDAAAQALGTARASGATDADGDHDHDKGRSIDVGA